MAWTGNNYEIWLLGDNSINIQGRIMVLVHGPFSHFKPSLISITFVLSKIWPRQASIMRNGYEEITQYIYRVGLWLLGSALPLIAIYIYTKFYLNAKSSFKVICQTRYRQTDGRTDKQPLYTCSFGPHNNKHTFQTYLYSESNPPYLVSNFPNHIIYV